MSTTSRQLTTQGQERKRQLLDAASRLFAQQGYSDTRVIDIVNAAGVAKGLFYWYFDNKEALFRELAADIRHQLRKTQRQAMDRSADGLVQLIQGTIASVRFMAEHSSFFSLLEIEGRTAFGPARRTQVADELRRGTEVHLRDVQAIIRKGQEDGTITGEDEPELMALATVGAVAQFSHFHRTGRVELSLEELGNYVARLVTRIVTADEATAKRCLKQVMGNYKAAAAERLTST